MSEQLPVAVSIIIPVYNAGDFLRECLDSVVNQTLREIEIICVNDGSQDGSLNILREYADKDNRIRIIDTPNQGQAIARNLAISVATGKYVAFIDSDDIADIELCHRVYESAEKNRADLVIYDYVRFSKDHEIKEGLKETSSLMGIIPSNREKLLAHMGVVWTKLVRLDWLREHAICFPEGYIYEDILVHWQLLTLVENLTILPQRLYRHRTNRAGTTCRTDWKRTDSIFIYDMIKSFLVRNTLYEQYRDLFLNRQLSNLSSVADMIDSSYHRRVVELILERLGEEEWYHIRLKNELRWQARDFFLALRGDVSAKMRRALWLFARGCFRACTRRIRERGSSRKLIPARTGWLRI